MKMGTWFSKGIAYGCEVSPACRNVFVDLEELLAARADGDEHRAAPGRAVGPR